MKPANVNPGFYTAHMVPTPDDLQLAARGVQLGLYTGLDLQSCEAERLRLLSEGVALPIQRVLMDRGLVDEAAWERLTRPGAASQAPVAARIGAYEILCALAKGAAGQVFLAREPETGRQVAVKLLMPHATENQRRRFARESELLAQLRHPNGVIVSGAADFGRGSPLNANFIALAYCKDNVCISGIDGEEHC